MKIARIDSHSVKVPYTFGGSHKGEGLRTWTTNNIRARPCTTWWHRWRSARMRATSPA